jgi:hypothetical protein
MQAARRLAVSVVSKAVMFSQVQLRNQHISSPLLTKGFLEIARRQLCIDTFPPPSRGLLSLLGSPVPRGRTSTYTTALFAQPFSRGTSQSVRNLIREATLPGASNQSQGMDPMQQEGTQRTTSNVSETETLYRPMGADRCPGGTPAIGIDLGTAFSRVAVWQKDSLEVIPLDSDGNKEMPSCVAFGDPETETSILVGRHALERLPKGGAIHRVRRIIGRVDTDESLISGAQFWSFMVQSLSIGVRPIVALKKGADWVSVTPEEAASLLFHQLKRSAERFLKQEVRNVVLTTPAAFNRFQCRLLAESAARAGLCVQRIVAEPNAVGLLYAYQKKMEGGKEKAQESGGEVQEMETETNVLVFHLGSGYCSVGIVR